LIQLGRPPETKCWSRAKLYGPDAAAATKRKTTTTIPARVEAAAASRATRAAGSRRTGTARANSGVATPRKATGGAADREVVT
jgi:hypothetical protein